MPVRPVQVTQSLIRLRQIPLAQRLLRPPAPTVTVTVTVHTRGYPGRALTGSEEGRDGPCPLLEDQREGVRVVVVVVLLSGQGSPGLSSHVIRGGEALHLV